MRNWFVGREGRGSRSGIDNRQARSILNPPSGPHPQDHARVAGYGEVLGKEQGARQQGLGVF